MDACSTTAMEPTLRMSGRIDCLAWLRALDEAPQLGSGDLRAVPRLKHRVIEAGVEQVGLQRPLVLEIALGSCPA